MSTPFKMKGFSGFGNEKTSPAKISDEAVVEAQKKLDHTELDFREPGWTKLARGIVDVPKEVVGAFAGGKKKQVTSGGKGKGSDGSAMSSSSSTANSVQDIASKNQLSTNQNNSGTGLTAGTFDAMNQVGGAVDKNNRQNKSFTGTCPAYGRTWK